MGKFLLIIILATSLVSGVTNSTQQSEPILSTYQIYDTEDPIVKQISEKYEITRKLTNGYEVIVPAKNSEELLALVPDAILIQKDNSLEIRNLSFGLRGLKNSEINQYHLYPEIIEKLQKLSQEKPEIVQFIEYGKSADGRTLFAVKISDNVQIDENEPELMITSATHGDEIITTEVVLGLIDKLINGYQKDARLTQMIANYELYFIPVVNADGFVNRARYDKGLDPNRSYPYPEDPERKPTKSIAELINFFKSRNFEGSLDFHAYGELTMYPWAYTDKPVSEKDHEIFHAITKKMAATNGYTYGPISKVIYIAKGSSADYYYWTKNTIALAVEVGTSKSPNQNQIEKYIKDQTESTWLFIESF